MRILRKALLAAIAALLLSTVAPRAQAQTLEPPAPRQGYYLSVGFHYGTINTWEDDEALGTWFVGHTPAVDLDCAHAAVTRSQQRIALRGHLFEGHVRRVRSDSEALRPGPRH
jgi:hypothetical protein